MRNAGTWLGRTGAALAAAGFLAAVGAGAATPITDSWAADPDSQFVLDVKLRQYRLNEPVRAYQTPEGTCIVFGDFLTALDVPMKIDLGARKAEGWAFKEDHKISIDAAAGEVSYGTSSEKLAKTAIRETSEGWCVDSGALTRWFGISVKPMTNGSMLVLESEAKLPVELAIEREKRAANLHKASFDIDALPQVRLPYRMWRAPALDFVVSGGVTYSAHNGVKVDRRSSIFAAGEVAHLSYDALIATNQKGVPDSLRVRAYRSDPDGGLLGPLKATHFGFGDVAGLATPLTGSTTSGRGAVVTNRPLANPTSFDRTSFEGDLPSGWDAELYRNGQLLAFARSDSRQRYVFDDVQLLYGENDISIVLYGPQGQVRTRNELINVGRENVPPGKNWYWAGANQPSRDLVSLHKVERSPSEPDMQAAVALEHGLDERTSVGVLARTMLLEDERVTFVEGTVRRSLGSALVEVGAAKESGGGTAARAQVLAKVGALNISAEAATASDFHLRGARSVSVKEARLALDAPIKLGRTVIPAHADAHYVINSDGSRQLEAAARLSASINAFNLATDVRYTRQYLANGPAPPANVTAGLIGTGRVGQVRVRGATEFEISPQSRFRSAELSGYWSASDTADWEGTLAYDGPQKRGRARISHIRRFDAFALAVTGEAATDGSVAVGFNMNFSLDWAQGLTMSRKPLAGAGSVRARVYRDVNGNGIADAGEPFEKGAIITAGQSVSEQPTDAAGRVLLAGLPTYRPITVGLDRSSLSDPMLAPKKALQVVTPRPGVPAEVEIALVASGEIEGSVVRNGGLGFEGVELELLDSTGAVVATTRSDFDGYFLFERIPYGEYSIRLGKESSEVIGISRDIGVKAVISDEQPVLRLGSTPLERQTIASK
ncbi:carboxypeptidase regulatory-like domain-containing protein [Sphingomonas sabuli]|uniref:Carboxypeptidase regulatory-like domain-containing protein n=1 Tax=Sphingomonas sabuli TaxID=2764186 RepID=A0A7G9L0G6_9SPHN|nr:carboxypeptidase regulatory-like domain-containing protein [Sphingomonas sabuli]QNM82115.1 carboxypeptidase regulatory-like domain-containing protein [Sphingomonas sabuli]